MTPFEIRHLPIDSLIPADYNPRRVLSPKDKAYQKLKASLEEFGLVEPLIWNEWTGRVVGGHARLRILRELGVKTVPVSVVHLTDAREKALNVMLNNQEAQARYDPAKLATLLEELHGTGDLEMTGFGEDVLEVLRLEPPDESSLAPPQAERVELTIVTDLATYEKVCERLDGIVREFDLVTHVRRGF